MKNADMIVDLQYGSTGKGLIAGYLAMKNKYDVVVTANMPNAGHTFIDAKGNKMIHKVLPNGVVSPNCKYALIGPGAIISVERLKEELEYLWLLGHNHFGVIIHPNAVVLIKSHKKVEEHRHLSIGSTMQGSAAAMIHKIGRNPKDNPTFGHVYKSYHNGYFKVVSINGYNSILKNAENILLEGAQGFSLGINERFYPFCTSRDCTPARFLADMGVPLRYLRAVIGTARVHPIRVGSPEGGYSGDVYDDQEETSWEELGLPEERTTVTNRVRRVFTFSKRQIKDALWACDPDEVFLNFCNYSNPTELEEVKSCFGNRIKYTGWGATVNDIMEE